MPGDLPPDLKDHYAQGRLILFIGAGASASLSWTVGSERRRPPTWRELVDHAAGLLGFHDPGLLRVRGDDLQILEFFNLERHGLDELINWLVGALQCPDDTLRASPIHAELAKMDLSRVIYTTNYDDFVERALALHGRASVRIAHEHDMPAALARSLQPPPLTQVVKFHGDLNSRATMVLTESHYQRRLRLDSPMDLRLRADLLGRAVLFLGYSFRDPNVSYLFSLVNEAFQELPESEYGRRAFIAIPDPSRFEQRMFQERRIAVIALDSSQPTAEVAALLQAIRA